jgi:hypothetical protein
VVSDKLAEEGFAVDMAGKGAPRAAALGFRADGPVSAEVDVSEA